LLEDWIPNLKESIDTLKKRGVELPTQTKDKWFNRFLEKTPQLVGGGTAKPTSGQPRTMKTPLGNTVTVEIE
jgi:hypothetical protein